MRFVALLILVAVLGYVAGRADGMGWRDWTDTPTLMQRVVPGCKPTNLECEHGGSAGHHAHARAGQPALPSAREGACERYRIEYDLRHPAVVPKRLRLLVGCKRWTADYAFHSRIHGELSPSVEAAMIETVVSPTIPEGKP